MQKEVILQHLRDREIEYALTADADCLNHCPNCKRYFSGSARIHVASVSCRKIGHFLNLIQSEESTSKICDYYHQIVYFDRKCDLMYSSRLKYKYAMKLI